MRRFLVVFFLVAVVMISGVNPQISNAQDRSCDPCFQKALNELFKQGVITSLKENVDFVEITAHLKDGDSQETLKCGFGWKSETEGLLMCVDEDNVSHTIEGTVEIIEGELKNPAGHISL